MSSFSCPHCGTLCSDSPRGYVSAASTIRRIFAACATDIPTRRRALIQDSTSPDACVMSRLHP